MIKKHTYVLHSRISLVAPIDGVCLEQKRIDFQSSATVEQRASAQAILDAFDPVQAQAEIEAEEAAERTRAEWLRTQTKDVREKFADMQAELDIAKTKWQAEFILLRDWARKKGYPG